MIPRDFFFLAGFRSHQPDILYNMYIYIYWYHCLCNYDINCLVNTNNDINVYIYIDMYICIYVYIFLVLTVINWYSVGLFVWTIVVIHLYENMPIIPEWICSAVASACQVTLGIRVKAVWATWASWWFSSRYMMTLNLNFAIIIILTFFWKPCES